MAFPDNVRLGQLMLQQFLDCPNGYGAMNGHAETRTREAEAARVASSFSLSDINSPSLNYRDWLRHHDNALS
jgi:hypothetical protein